MLNVSNLTDLNQISDVRVVDGESEPAVVALLKDGTLLELKSRRALDLLEHLAHRARAAPLIPASSGGRRSPSSPRKPAVPRNPREEIRCDLP